MKVLLTGAGGLLGNAFCDGLAGRQVVAVGRGALDIRDPARLQSMIQDTQPDVLINCAAHTDVDGAEAAPEASFAVNSILPGMLAQSCRRSGTMLLHVSSTGCYGDGQERPYTEEDMLRPTTVHHRSKASGEQAIREAGCEALIVRTGWLFGGAAGAPKNFVWRRLEEAAGKSSMVSDITQTGNPTWVNDLVKQTLVLLERRILGTFNCVGNGVATRFDYVSHLVAASGLPCRVEPGDQQFVRAARVSPNESAVNWRLSLLGLDLMPAWTTSLSTYIGQIQQTPQWSTLIAARNG